ncbi:MAG: bifunctional phosphopantothenoylcysteine decarboxylase/phosphopantothenate--cysteine ligase CoaBC [Desulfococcus multivorans]|jgi:phosphopantothenoylcysteine decarboxylase/phosphopantothenate--cysteine ligase|uniref:bifunctional phosphopantothenoylcysteine decarboxylase/phosphopantothenate--cysteine ligase CoaBC n=1 Tax=Desulfococcus sp. TaxID=2025834 RepID=UPI002A442898|nr:bifunctional phosphopantothenoylcysteine decarboxylase/phosphopantothenate--cysteine ligase CoaBC [Desulfococcus multivorans]
MKTSIHGVRIVLGVSGGIAAYKSVELLRLLTKSGADVRVMMTRNATRFVGPMTFEALSGKRVCTDLFDRSDPDASIRHIEWAQDAQGVVIAPATANMVAKYAHGFADDALSTFLLAVTCPMVICPSMNSDMYLNPSVQRNLECLKSDGHLVLEPGAGELACRTVGPGRLPEPAQILDRLTALLTRKDLAGKTVLVTAGPTREPIDPVRFISNPSSGKMGYALARAAEYRGADVVLVSGPTALPDPANVKTVRVRTAGEMALAVFDHMKDADIIIKSAAVGDYRAVETAAHKIKKTADQLVLTLTRNEDILKSLGERKTHQILVGFAAETRDLKENAREKLVRKNLDMIVGNLVGHPASGFGSDTNRVTLFYRDGSCEPLAEMDKDAVAHIILDRVRERCL